VLVPSKRQRNLLTEHEHRDYAQRLLILSNGGIDPGRTLPQVSHEFEYIPTAGTGIRIHMHNPTPYDPTVFVFDNKEIRTCPLLHFKASHFALMVMAQPHLSTQTRFQCRRADDAEMEIYSLLQLYKRCPTPNASSTPMTSIPSNYFFLCESVELPNSAPSARILNDIPGSPPTVTPSPSEPPMALRQAHQPPLTFPLSRIMLI